MFLTELEEFIRKHCSGQSSSEITLQLLENLLVKHFYYKQPQFTPKHLGPASGFYGYAVYFFHMIIPYSGLSKTQQPKCYLYKTDETISFLCLNSHVENYDDSKLRKIAKQRLAEIIEVLKTTP